jgi:four helix bundle protein
MTPYEERKEAMRRRTKAFASLIVRFYVALDKRREELRVLGKQLLRSGTSVAANFRESTRARSVDEFIAKIEQCVQECDESQLWLELLRDDCGLVSPHLTPLWREADELIAIFVTMSKNTKANRRNEKAEIGR